MKGPGLIIAALVLAALTGALYWSDHRKSKDADAPAVDVAPKILTVPLQDISRIEIKKKGSDPLDIAKDASGKWQITAPKAYAADQDSVGSIAAALSSLSSQRLLEEKSADLAQYGLTEPSLELDVTFKEKTARLLIGDETPTGNGSFAVLAGDPRVFTVASYTKSSFDKSLNDLRDKRLITSDVDKASQIELLAEKQVITFARNKDSWQILKPRPLRADNSTVEDLVRALKDARMDLGTTAPDEKKLASSFAAASPVATAKVTDAAGVQELQVRKSKGDYYAKSSAVAGIYKVSAELEKALDKKLGDFRNKKLFDFGFDEPSKVEIHDGAKSYFLTKGGQDWWSDGKKLEPVGVQSVIDKIRELAATKFVDSGFTSSALDLIVISNDGKRVEKVLMSRNGDKYIAKREGEPALYELDGSAVTDLQKLASQIKPAEEPKLAAPAKK